jgi:hypothetical protein
MNSVFIKNFIKLIILNISIMKLNLVNDIFTLSTAKINIKLIVYTGMEWYELI